jgi:peptidoglycan/xylan/chitin deacetylase (PgdA/CDA1 family)
MSCTLRHTAGLSLMRRWCGVFASLALVLVLGACAAGAPTVATIPTATIPPTTIPAPTVFASPSPLPSPTVPAPIPGTAEVPHIASPAVPIDGTGGGIPASGITPDDVTPTPRPAPPPDAGTGSSQLIRSGDGTRNEVALTFDAGDDRGNAAEILDILKQYDIKASFGVTGKWAEANPDLVKRMVDEGHMVFNHTWNHRSFTGESTGDGGLTVEQQRQEVADTERLIRKITDGYDTAPYFRPPYGDYDDQMLANLEADGYSVTLMWTCDTMGWNGATVDEIVTQCGDNASAGDIILLHVGAASADADALPALIKSLEGQGLKPVTVEQLLQP